MRKTVNYLLLSIIAIGFIFQVDACDKDVDGRYYGCDCETWSDVSALVAVGPSNPSDSYDTYAASGKIDADGAMGCHTTMKIRFRWVDEDRSKTNERPTISYEYQSLWGWFPSYHINETTITDNEGHIWWEKELSESAGENGETSYGVYVEYNGDGGANSSVYCQIDISYPVYSEDAYLTGCTKSPL